MRHVVTGAFGYTGRYIAERLLGEGEEVATLTGHPERPNRFGERVRAMPFHFEDPDALCESLRGVDVLYNTYWVRFSHGDTRFETAVRNTKILIDAARAAGVKRFVHVSITNPSLDSPLPYFSGKAELEQHLADSGLSHAILRPTVIFGHEDILINNIAWFLRRFPAFAVPGDGRYCLQPIYVEDMAALAVEVGQGKANVTLDAVGPEVFTFNDLLRTIRETVGSYTLLMHVPPGLALLLSGIVGRVVNDVILTSDEVKGLMSDLLVSPEPPPGTTRLTDWLQENAETVGKAYANELGRHYGGVERGAR